MRSRAGGGGRRMRGLAVGIVTNINDPEKMGRVKVKFPWLDDTVESNWARVTGWYAGASRGTMFIPEVDDEVMLAFDNGDPNHPYVIGAVWNGKHKVPGPGNTDGKNDHKWFKSRSGHDLEFLDSSGGEKIRLVDCKAKNSMVMDTAADTITTEAKSGKITISACKTIQIDCVDFNITTSKGRGLTVGASHTVKVGASRSVSVSQGSFHESAGSSYSLTAASVSTSSSGHSSVGAGAMTMNSGSMKSSVTNWLDMTQSAVVTRTVGMQKSQSDVFATVASDGGPTGVFTLTSGPTKLQGDQAVYLKGKVVTLTGGLINLKGSSILIAKDIKGGKAALASFMGGLLMLNPGGITFPAAKMLDMILGMDIHGPTLPAPVPPAPLPPLPVVPMPFAGPIVLSVQPTVLVNFMPAASSGSLAISFHMPPLPWPWVPITYGAILKGAIMALVTAPFMALLELARGQLSALAGSSTSPVLKNGFVQGFLGKPPDGGGQGGSDITVGRFFPMFGSPQAFLGFLASAMPLPVANAQATIASPTVSAADSPMALAMPMGGNSCSNIPVAPNAAVLGFSNVLTGMSLSQLLGVMAWNAVNSAAQHGLNKGVEAAASGTARQIGKSKNETLRNVTQSVSDFLGAKNCIAEGHPVDVVSGTMFNEQVDFELHGPHPLRFSRFYNSKAQTSVRADAFSFGPGWRHAFEETLIADEADDGGRNLALRDAEGRVLGFAQPMADGQQSFHPLERLVMTRVDGRTYAIEGVDRTRRIFEFPGGEPGKAAPAGYLPGVGAVARLVAIEPAGGARTAFEYEAGSGRLTHIRDAHDRTVKVERDKAGRITDLRLVHAAGRECNIFLAAYQYDADGRLIGHTDRNRNVRRFSYDGRGRLVKETDRCGYSFHFEYDAQDRCVLTHGDDNAYWVQLSYEPLGNVTTAMDGFGAQTVYKYDAKKLVTEILDAEGGVTKREYTEEGWLAAVTSPGGRRRELEHDPRGRLTSSLDGLGNRTSWEYDPQGRPVCVRDPAGGARVTVWDDEDRYTAESVPGGGLTTYTRDERGRAIAITSPEGGTRRLAWRSDNLLESERLADGRTRTWRYDPCGQIVEVTETAPDGTPDRRTTYHRDAQGWLTGVDRPADRTERFALDGEGREVRRTRGRRVETTRYNGMGKVVEHTDALGRTTHIRYDAHQRPVEYEAPSGQRWAWTRDRLGRTVRLNRPDGSRLQYTYDGDGLPTRLRMADGRLIERTWDAAGNLVAIAWPDGRRTTYAYDSANRLTSAECPGDRPLAWTYDTDGRVTSETQGDEWLRYKYDTAGFRRRRTTSWGDSAEYAWTPQGALAELTDELGGTHRFSVDAHARRQQWIEPGNMRHTRRYDEAHRLIESVFAGPGGDPAHQQSITWDAEDAVQSVRARDLRRGRDQSVHFDRDAVGRLTSESRNHGAPRAFRFDTADNLISSPDGETFQFGADQRLQSSEGGHAYRHDVGGRLVTTTGPKGKRSLWYDCRDRLIRVHTENDGLVTHEYDALGRRVRSIAELNGRVEEELFHWEGNRLARRVVRLLTATDPLRDEHYLWDPDTDEPLARIVHDRDGARRQTFHTDQRGAVVALSDDRGNFVWEGDYDAYGLCRESGPEAGAQPLRMMGQLHDAATGYDHHRYRVYDASTRRFLTPDPIGLFGGANHYAYPSDPATFGDPLGLEPCTPNSANGGHLGDDALVVRAGTCTPEQFTNGSGVTTNADGTLNGVSTQSRNGATVETLAQPMMNNQVGVTTAGDIRRAGGTIVADGTSRNPNHATVSGLTGEQLNTLFTPTQPNPVPKSQRGRRD